MMAMDGGGISELESLMELAGPLLDNVQVQETSTSPSASAHTSTSNNMLTVKLEIPDLDDGDADPGDVQKNSESVQSSGRRPSSEAPSGPCSKIPRPDNTTSPVEDGSNSPTVGGSALTGVSWTSTQCVYCNKTLVSSDVSPRLMECLHSACESCITSRLEEKTQSAETNSNSDSLYITCPICKINCSASGMIDQQFVVEKRDSGSGSGSAVSPDQKCNSCSDDNAATAWCCECSEFICDVCVQAHQRLKITKDHTIKTKEEGIAELSAANTSSSSMPEMFCKEHPQERLSLFCETCDKLTCRDCQLHKHRDHKYQFTTEMAAAARSSISALLSEVDYKRKLLGSAMNVIRTRQALIADKKKTLVHEITQTVVKLTNAINTRGKQLVLRLNEVCDSKQKTLNEKKLALEQLSAITDHCISFVNAALDQGSDIAILYSKKQVTSHLQKIKSRRADIPNPEIPVRIHLALEKIPDLIKVLSTIGNIVVDGKVFPASSSGSTSRPNSAGPSPQSQGPYHPPQPAAGLGPLQAKQQHPALVAAQGYSQGLPQQQQQQPRSQQQSPAPSHMQQQGPMQPAQSQLAHLNHMSQQLQRQTSSGNLMGPLGAVHPHSVPMGRSGGASVPMIRHPHVTSSTHPHHMTPPVDGAAYLAGLQELNLRGLLSQSPSYNGPPQQTQQSQQRSSSQANQYSRQALQAMQSYQTSGVYGQTGNQAMYNQQQQQRNSVPPLQGVVPTGTSARPPVQSPHALHHQQQQQQLQYQQQMQQQQQAQAQQQAAAKWHIPQHASNGMYNASGEPPPYGSHLGPNASVLAQHLQTAAAAANQDSFKITLRQPQQTQRAPSATVTSTNPKTPSPSLHGMNASEAAAHSLDKLCQDSVNDLMATIAKLDSNGVQVLAEGSGAVGGGVGGPGGKDTSPLVHSSTDDTTTSPQLPLLGKQTNVSGESAIERNAVDPNEDWCAVCMDGGELMCCDKCPKVFHQYCHIPTIDKLPDESEPWQCLLCVNFADVPNLLPGEKKTSGLTIRQQKIIERIVLELYCQYETSLAFREPVPLENLDYHSRVPHPMCLDMIRHRVQPGSNSQYRDITQLVADVRLMFHNAFTYNAPDSQIYKDALRLEEFFEQQIKKWIPEYASSNKNDENHFEGAPAKKAKLSVELNYHHNNNIIE